MTPGVGIAGDRYPGMAWRQDGLSRPVEAAEDLTAASRPLEPAADGLECRVRGRCQRLPRARPPHRVRDHRPHLRLVVDRVLLVARAEVEHPAPAPRVAAAAAEDLAALERADEHELLGR